MYAFHSTVRLKPGMEESFLSHTKGAADPILNAPGFVRRLLLRDRTNPGTFYYVSIWESFDALEAYRATEAVRSTVRDLGASAPFAAPIERVECEVILSDGAGGT